MSDSGITRIYRHESTNFTTVPNWVVRDPSYSPNAFRLLAYLLSHADGYELTYQQIERQTTLGRYAINKAAEFLIDHGWIELNRPKGPDGRWLAKQWIIKNPELTIPQWNDSIVEPFHSGTTSGHIEEQSIEKNTNKRKTLSEAKERELFNEWWQEYPRKLDKGAAFKAFKAALKRATFDELIAGAKAYASNRYREEEFTKYPATWLNADSWENEAEEAKPRNSDIARQWTMEYLAAQKEAEENAAPPPKCEHDANPALCKICLRGLR